MNQIMNQKFSSSGTSINSKKVPAVFKKVSWKKGTRNLDWGGGKYDTASEYMESIGCENVTYDPFNRTEEENEKALNGAPYDTVTVSNVLNVIMEKDIRVETVREAMRSLKKGGEMYIAIYEGDGSGKGRETKKDCWQNNEKLQFYVQELEAAGFKAKVKRGVIIMRESEPERATSSTVIHKLPKEELRELQRYRGYVRRRNACCLVFGNDESCCERQDYLEAKLWACHHGGWDVEKDAPAVNQGKRREQ